MTKVAPANVAVVILTFNEEDNLPNAIDSVLGWAREIHVVDSYSTDGTVDVALKYASEGVPITVVQHGFENYAAQWKWCLSSLPIQTEWTFKLDADERMTQPLKDECSELMDTLAADISGVLVPFHMVFLGKRMRYGGSGRNHVLRLWRTGVGHFDDRIVNESMLVPGLLARTKEAFIHHSTKDLTDWLEKHNRYSSLEARCSIER